MPTSSRSWSSISRMVAREQASTMEVGSSARRILGLSRKIRAIISRCIWPPDSSKGYLLVSSANFRLTKEQASVIISNFSCLDRFFPPRMLMQSSRTVSILLKVLKEAKGSWKMAWMPFQYSRRLEPLEMSRVLPWKRISPEV